MNGSVMLSVGQILHLKRGKDRIAYAGMLSDNIYSIAQIRNALSNNAFAWNLYYPKRKSDITIDGVNIYVENATPDEARLRAGQ